MANWSDILQSLGPGLGRPLGSGDVVPYRGASNSFGTVSNPEVATPGPSGPGAGFGAFGQDSFLNNLSSLMPAINAFIQAQNPVPSGQGTALPGTPPAATPGPGSADITAALNQQATGGSAGPAPTGPSAGGTASTDSTASGAPAPVGPLAQPGSGGEGAPGGDPGAVASGAPSGSDGSAGGGVGTGGSDGGVGSAAGGGSGAAGGMRGGGLVPGKPTKGDSVSARLQPGEFVIPKSAVEHLAATAPQVLSHVMSVSAAHAIANRARELTGVNGMPPQSSASAPQGYAGGGLVLPPRAVAAIHPAALEHLRRVVAAHLLASRMQQGSPISSAMDRMVGPAQPAAMSPSTGQFGRPAILPPLGPPQGDVSGR